MKKRIFPTLIALSALSVSASAAFYSVTGLSKLFAGASLEVMIMAGSLEVAKLVIASLLYQYWSTLNGLLKTYLTIATIVLIGITSAGIYGFLSSAYQNTATQSSISDREISIFEAKKQRFADNIASYETEKERLNQDISQLRNALSTGTTTQYVDRNTGQLVTRANSANRKAFEEQLNSALENKNKVDDKIIALNDSITTLEIKILDLKSNADSTNELGPLKYLSNLTGKPMDQIINWFLLVIVFVFDPLAIALVIAANFAFKQLKPTVIEHEVIEPEDEIEPMSFEDVAEQNEYINEVPEESTPDMLHQPMSAWRRNRGMNKGPDSSKRYW